MDKPRLRLSPRIRQALERSGAVLLFAAVAWLLLAALLAQLAHAAEFPKDIGAGTLLFRSSVAFDPAAPLATDVRISVAGIVARVTVAQRFRNPGSEWAEAVYALPLPDDAAVDRLTMHVGDRIIEGEIHEREEAKRIYTTARDSGQHASLVSQETPNLFTTAVANVGPGELVDIAVEYLQTAHYDSGEFRLRLPMTLTPRYGGTDTAEASLPAPGQPTSATAEALPVTTRATAPPINEATVHVVLAPGIALADVGSPSHPLHVTRDQDRYVLDTLAPQVPMDRDFVLTWRPNVGKSPALAALTETVGGTTYALLMLLPPLQSQTIGHQPREALYVIDTSGSMAGPSIAQAKAALKDALGRLTGADRFNVFEFNSTTSSLYRLPMPLTTQSYAEALKYVDRLDADGGTEMEPAIRAALAQPAAPGYLRQVVFLTDGGVANETALFTAIKQGLGDGRLFTIGIGAAPNSYFMRKAAEFGRGTYTHIGDTAAVGATMQALFDKLERVALTDVLVDWPAAAELYPLEVPDLYAGEPLVLTASFPARPSGGPLAVTVFGHAGDTPWSQSVAAHPQSLPGIAELWARRKIEYLIDSRVDGTDPELIRQLVIKVALAHHLVSPYTSLVAVDQTPARSAAAALKRQAVSNMAPAGSELTGLPQTASPAALYRWLGLALLLMAGLGARARLGPARARSWR
jgi:Ca-activated chloride channel homolog